MNQHQQANTLPATICEILQTEFNFPANLVFAQVATHTNGIPHLRTMRLYGIEEEYGLIFLTHCHSRKWRELQQGSRLALCFVHPNCSLQLLADCTTTLADYATHPDLFEKYWNLIKADVKKIYSDDCPVNTPYQVNYDIAIPKHPTTQLGMIIAQAYFWEYMSIAGDHPNSLRYHFHKNEQQVWVSQRMTVS